MGILESISPTARELLSEFALRNDIHARLIEELPNAPESNSTFSTFFGSKIYVMPGQKAACWMISSEVVSAAYREGRLSEADLENLATASKITNQQ